jgi:NAD(P)H dehydrogenase (quinone)
MKKILIIKVHPKEDSFCNALTDKYIEGAKQSKHKIKIIILKNLKLEQHLKFEHTQKPILTQDLAKTQELILWADHLVFTYPTWWATPPALLKIFIEIIFLPGFAYKYKRPKAKIPRWDKLLRKKTSRIISTMDSPTWYYTIFGRDPGYKMMKDILNFCGVKPVQKNYFGSVKFSNLKKRKKWLKQIYNVGFNE